MSPPPTPHDAPLSSPILPADAAPVRNGPAPHGAASARSVRGAWGALAAWAAVLGVVYTRYGGQENGVIGYFALALLAALLAGAVLAMRRPVSDGAGHSHRPGSLRAIVAGLQNTFAVSLAFFFFVSHGFTGQHLEQAWFDFIRPLVRASFADDTPPVVVVDMTDVPLVVPPGADPEDRITDRRPLQEFLQNIARFSDPSHPPVAVGIDVNFRDPQGGFIAPEDGEFFRDCLAIENKFNHGANGDNANDAARNKPFRIFLGVAGGVALPREVWLGSPRYAALATSIDVPTNVAQSLYSVLWRDDRDQENNASRGLQTMGAAMASVYAPGWREEAVPPLTEQEGETTVGALWGYDEKETGPLLKARTVLVDYRWLNTLRTAAVPLGAFARDPRRVRELAGKIVLVGDVKGATVEDAFFVAGEPRPVPGVFLHACMASTLIAAPLYQIKPLARTFLDLGISLAILFSLAALDRRALAQNRHVQPYIVTGALAIAGVLVFLVSLLLAYQRIIWADAALIVFALMLDRPLETFSKSLPSWARRAEQAAFTEVAPPTRHDAPQSDPPVPATLAAAAPTSALATAAAPPPGVGGIDTPPSPAFEAKVLRP